MQEKLEQFEEYRTKKLALAKKLTIAGGILLPIGVLLFMFLGDLFILGAILMVAGIILLVIQGTFRSNVNSKFKEEFVPAIIKDFYPNANYNSKGGLPWRVIDEPGFFHEPDRFFSEDYLSAEYEGVPFVLSDYDLQERHTTTDSKGNTTTTYQTYAKGRFMIFDFKREFNQTLKILQTTWLGSSTSRLKKVELESLEFTKKFKTFTSSEELAFYILTPQMQLKILEFASKFKGSVFLSFQNGKLYVAINDSVDFLDISCSKAKDANELVEIIKSQLSLPAAVIHELQLSGDKYTNGPAL